MKRCNCCGAPAPIASCSNHRAWVLPFMYAILAEHSCGSTVAFVVWEEPEEGES